MARTTKGITIEFDANTTKLDRAIKNVNSEASGLQKELNAVNRALKFNPKNTELLAQKQTILKGRIEQTKKQLDLLKQSEKNMTASGVDKNSEEFRKLRRQIVEAESKVKHFSGELKKIQRMKFDNLSKSFKKVGGKMSDLGGKMTTTVTAPIVAGFAAASKSASDYEENMNKIDVAFGDSADAVKEWAKTARSEFGMSQVQATDSASAFGALGKGIGLAEGDAATMATTLAGLSADLGSYFNVGVDQSAKALEGIFTGESEALKKFGVVMTDTNLQKFAEDQGLVWKEMSQMEKTTLRYNYVLTKTKDAQGDFSRTSDGTANSTKIFKATIQDLGTSIGTNLLPLLTPLIQKVTSIIDRFTQLSPETQNMIVKVGLVVAAIGPLIMVLGKVASGIGSIIGILPLLASPAGIAVAAIAGIIAAGVALYKNWDKIKAKVESFKNAIVDKFTALKDKVAGIWDKIKSFFTFDFKMPDFGSPHFKIIPEGWRIRDLLDGVIPSIDIDWYAKGGIFKNPSVIGVGEAGPEAVLPIDRLSGMMSGMADSIVNGILTGQGITGGTGDIVIPIYLYPSGPKMGEQIVKSYDIYKRQLG